MTKVIAAGKMTYSDIFSKRNFK